jgi:peroxiredoxin (alkyl hydroperoxide reductase subunit C)
MQGIIQNAILNAVCLWNTFLPAFPPAHEVLTPAVGRNVSETIREVQAFQLVRDSKGTEATPAGWKPGKITLKPGPDLVGKVWEVWKTSMAAD